MSFAEDLRKEIDNYQKKLDRLNAIDINEVKRIVEETCLKKRAVYRKEVAPRKKELTQITRTTSLIDKVEQLSFEIKSLIYSLYDRHTTKKRKVEIQQSIQKKYEELLKCRQDIQEMPLEGNSQLRQVKALRENLATKKKNVESELNESYLELSQYMSLEEQKLVKAHWQACISASTKTLVSKSSMNPNLIRFIAIAAFDKEFAQHAPALEENFSIVCQNLYQNICSEITKMQGESTQGVFEFIELPYIAESKGKKGLFYELPKSKTSNRYRVITKSFLKDIVNELESNPNVNLPDLASIVREKYVVGVLDVKLNKSLIEFKRLYEETPGQILITEQRYYKEKELEQQRIQAELDRREMARQAALDRKNDLRIAQMEEKRERDRELREWAEREAQERKEKLERNRQKKAEAAERYKKTMADAKARQEAMRLCWKCANYGRGCHGGILACGNFRPKR